MSSNTVIATNILALNSNRRLGAIGKKQYKASQRLSSGLKINSAADDAAGLGISQKMKAQIRGLDSATKNSEDAISLIQTAEGSISEMQSMLQRIRELNVQAANDTNTTEERVKIANEMIELIDELDSMSSRTEFNGQALIDGNFSGNFQIGANSGQKISISMSEINSQLLGNIDFSSKAQQQAVLGGRTVNADGSITVTDDDLSSLRDAYAQVVETLDNLQGNNITFDNSNINNAVGGTGIAIQELRKVEDVPEEVMSAIEDVNVALNNILRLAASATDNINAQNTSEAIQNLKDLRTIFESREFVDLMESTYDLINSQMSSLFEVKTTLQGFVANPEEVDLSYFYFSSFLRNIDVSLSQISDVRSKLGATQNRIEYTINNLEVSSENLSSANSRIEDADMAQEMMNLTQANVLQEAAISMLAQANQNPNNITQLLS